MELRIVASLWLAFAALAGAAIAIDSLRMLSRGDTGDAGLIAINVAALVLCLFAVTTAIALLRRRRWAAICIRIIAVLALLYCLSFTFLSHFSFAWVGLLGIAFAVYTFVVVAKLKNRDPVNSP